LAGAGYAIDTVVNDAADAFQELDASLAKMAPRFFRRAGVAYKTP
jgi:hypothetical protein